METEKKWTSEALRLLQNARYYGLTFFQKTIIPRLLKGKDLFIQARDYAGKTASFILFLCLKLNRKNKGIKAVVFTYNSESAKKIFQEFLRISRPLGLKISLWAVA